MALSLRSSFAFEPRIQLPNNLLFCGSTQSGKTSLLLQLLRDVDTKFTPKPSKVLFLYNCFQEVYNELRQHLQLKGIDCEFVKESKICDADLDSVRDPNGQTVIIIDDNSVSAASSPEIAQLFTMARHKGCSIVLLLHFIYGPWASSRIIAQNAGYMFLMKSVRMWQQVQTLGTQIGKKNLVAIYEQECSSKLYGYVMVDLTAKTPDVLRIRSDLDKDHQRVLM